MSLDSEIDSEEKRCRLKKRVLGRGVTVELQREDPALVGRMAEVLSVNPLAMAGVGRGVRRRVQPGGVVTPQQEPERSRLTSPVAASQKPKMSPVQEVPEMPCGHSPGKVKDDPYLTSK